MARALVRLGLVELVEAAVFPVVGGEHLRCHLAG
jgi:hypothetical protein